MDLFKDLFSWLPLYSYVDAGKCKLIIMHGGISDKINLKKLNSLSRNRCENEIQRIYIYFFVCFFRCFN
jgi:hypothetical protein